jgi:hypothetical protein
MNSERPSSLHKVSGGTDEQQEKVSHDFKKEFETKKFYEDAEREKTPEEKEIIDAVIRELNDFLGQYGAQPLDIENNHISILDKSHMTQDTFEYLEECYPDNPAFYKPDTQHIVVLSWKIPSHILFAKYISHELVHFLSYTSAAVSVEGDKSKIHRLGLSVQPYYETIPLIGAKYLSELNEAITEELVIRFNPKLKHIPLLTKKYQEIEDARKSYDDDDIADIKIEKINTPEGDRYRDIITTYSYFKLRKKLNILIDTVYEKRKNDVTSREDVFTVFAKAAMTGDVKGLTLLLDSTLGSGTFKKIAQSEYWQ